MNPDQINQVIELLRDISSTCPKGYTLTGAADWPLLVAVGGILVVILGAMWVDLRSNIRDGRAEWKAEIDSVKRDVKGDFDMVWKAHKDCQDSCCPRGKTNG